MISQTDTRVFSLPGASLHIRCEERGLAEKIISTLQDLFYFSGDKAVPHERQIFLNFRRNDFSCIIPGEAETLSASPLLSVQRCGDNCYITSRDSLFSLDLSTRSGTGYMGPEFWEGDTKSVQDFFMVPMLWLLRTVEVYGVHANGLASDGRGVLIVGDTGCGKSSIALGLISAGWNYLSDDLALLTRNGEGVSASAFPKKFSFDPRLKRHLKGLVGLPEELLSGSHKRVSDITHNFAGKFLYACRPDVLVFPEITQKQKSVVRELDPTAALVLLIKQSGGIMVDRARVMKQVEVLKTLISQTSSYHLFAGRDLYEDPSGISELFRCMQ